MAKRRRLTPANPTIFGAAPETKSAGLSRAPIADVASEAATSAALDQMADALTTARETGRMVLELSLDQIVLDHLVRDRIVVEDAELEALVSSIAVRGQQTPIEVLALPDRRYGLISGWRRCQAIAALTEEGRHDGTVLALLRQPAEASDAYLSMVEENEIRVGLSYFERARIAKKAVEQGVFDTEKAALLALFASASRPKRSKIRSFLPLVAAFDGVLGFPHMIGERLGLRLSAALERDPALAGRIAAAVETEQPQSGPEEQALLQRLLTTPKASKTASEARPAAAPEQAQLRPDLVAQWSDEAHWLRLSGRGLTPELRTRLLEVIRDL